MKTIRILIVDDHTLVRDGFRALLEKVEGVTVIGEGADGLDAVRLVREEQPDVVLMDVGMPGLNGLEATVQIKSEFPETKVIMLSMHANEEYVLQALRSGASGYLLKDSNKQELELALKSVDEGNTYLSPRVSRHVIESYVQSVQNETSPLEQVTPRQKEILKLIAEGRTNKEMAQILNISIKTVEAHRTQLMERLQIHDVAGLVRFAVKVGLVT